MEKIPYHIGKQILKYFEEILIKEEKKKNNTFINNFKDKYELKMLQNKFNNLLHNHNINLFKKYEKYEQFINEKLNNNEIIEISRLKSLYRNCINMIQSIKNYYEHKDKSNFNESNQFKRIKLNDNEFEFMIFKFLRTIYIINLNNTEFDCECKFNLSEENESFDKIIEQYIEDFKKKYLKKMELFKESFLNNKNNIINKTDYENNNDYDFDNLSTTSTQFSVNLNDINDNQLIENENEYFLYYNLNNKSIIPEILTNIKNIENDYDYNKIINKIFEYKGNLILFLGGYFCSYNIKKRYFTKIFNINLFFLVVENSISILYLDFYIKTNLLKIRKLKTIIYDIT